MDKRELGSMTAKGGFINEAKICEKFLNFKDDLDAQAWLGVMGYDVDKIDKLVAVGIPVRINMDKAISLGVSKDKYEDSIKFKKADIQIRIEIVIDNIVYVENISLKKANKNAGFNQVDKRAVLTYQKIWGFDEEIAKWLRAFTGDILPKDLNITNSKDQRRLFLTEIPQKHLDKIINFFENNKNLIICDILKGRGGLSAEWFLVTRKNSNKTFDWVLKDINYVCNFYSQGDVVVTPRGSLKIGRVTMQRKGGTPDPTSLQFKINPLELFGDK